MRIAVVDTYYPAFLAEHYRARPGLEERPYEVQLASLLDACFGTSDAYTVHLRELGHDAIDVIPNCLELQLRWASEHGRPGPWRRRRVRLPGIPARLGRDALLQDVAMSQIDQHGADVVYCQDLSFLNGHNLERLRAEGRLVVGQVASGMPSDETARRYDLILSSFPHYPARLREMGVDSDYLPIAFYERVLDRLRRSGTEATAEAERPHRLVFVGGIDPAVHGDRVELLEELARTLPLEVWGYGADRLPTGSALRRAYRGQAWGIEMYRVLAGSRIVINRHIGFAEGYANNMRLFEATGVGALLVTESAPNLADFFEPDHEVVSYDGPPDLMEKLDHLIAHDDERQAIAAAGQARTLRDHTYSRLMARLAGMIEARLA